MNYWNTRSSLFSTSIVTMVILFLLPSEKSKKRKVFVLSDHNSKTGNTANILKCFKLKYEYIRQTHNAYFQFGEKTKNLTLTSYSFGEKYGTVQTYKSSLFMTKSIYKNKTILFLSNKYLITFYFNKI